MSILIIDDSEANITLLEVLLSQDGFQNSETASDLSQALEILAKREVDLILLSYILPQFSGVEACSIITSDLRYEDIPVILITANTDMQTLKSSFENGASDYIAKPINKVELLARVHAHLIRKQISDERKNSAITDALTHIYNRRYFDIVFDRQYHKSLLEKLPFSFLMIDIDNFKKYNDNYGHQKGDEALKSVAAGLKSVLKRESDYLFRLGGEEFAILLYDTPQSYIEALLDDIHQAIKDLNILHEYNSDIGRLTISVGVTTALSLDDVSKFDIYNSADKALYEAKAAGRNRTVMSKIEAS